MTSKDIRTSALILSAGFGSRIAEVTLDPKSLLPINGLSLLHWHMEHFLALGIRHVVVAVGYRKEKIKEHLSEYQKRTDLNIEFVDIDNYNEKGNTFTLYKGLCQVPGDCIVFDADVIYEETILKAFLDDSRQDLILVGENTLDDIEAAKTLIDRQGHIRLFIDKRAVTEEEAKIYEFVGEAIGILKFSKKTKEDLLKCCEDFFILPGKDKLNWEHVMNYFLSNPQQKLSVHPSVSSLWMEIDTAEDYNKAREMFSVSMLSEQSAQSVKSQIICDRQ